MKYVTPEERYNEVTNKIKTLQESHDQKEKALQNELVETMARMRAEWAKYDKAKEALDATATIKAEADMKAALSSVATINGYLQAAKSADLATAEDMESLKQELCVCAERILFEKCKEVARILEQIEPYCKAGNDLAYDCTVLLRELTGNRNEAFINNIFLMRLERFLRSSKETFPQYFNSI